jgi:adenylylsulfate kinase
METPFVTHKMRVTKNGHNPFVLWLTGLSGSGKSTLAGLIESELFRQNVNCYNLDGDHLRVGLNSDLDFSRENRYENIRRTGEVAKLFVDAGLVVIVSLVSPFQKIRTQVRNKLRSNEFIEVYVKCSLETCEKRDPKGLYKKARLGLIKEFTGIDSPYEIPENPELIVDTEKHDAQSCTASIFKYLLTKGYL